MSKTIGEIIKEKGPYPCNCGATENLIFHEGTNSIPFGWYCTRCAKSAITRARAFYENEIVDFYIKHKGFRCRECITRFLHGFPERHNCPNCPVTPQQYYE